MSKIEARSSFVYYDPLSDKHRPYFVAWHTKDFQDRLLHVCFGITTSSFGSGIPLHDPRLPKHTKSIIPTNKVQAHLVKNTFKFHLKVINHQ
jgi:hypothetical protein